MRKLFQKFKRDNGGSGIITVLIAVFFVLALGATLLYVSYTGYMIKVSERKSEENFYTAEIAMDELRAGLQKAVSDSLASAYTDILVQYSSLVLEYNKLDADTRGELNDYIEKIFMDEFLDHIKNWKHGEKQLFDGTHSTYDVTVMKNFLSNGSNVKLTASSDNETEGVLNINYTTGDVTLKDVTVTYTKSGYETKISTDIVIHTPPFSYSPTEYSLTNLNRLSLVAGGALTRTYDATATLKGDVYAGSVLLNTNGIGLTYSDGTFTCAGSLDVENSSFTMNNASLWAGSITAGSNATLNLSGSVNVADDLTLNGPSANVTLGGSGTNDQYNGFGYLDDTDDLPSSSSSIIVNGRSNTLNMSGLESLTLAGNSFINAIGSTGSATYAMGQSIATRSDQLAYLVPASCLTEGFPSNPCFNTTAVPDGTSAAILQNIKTLSAKSGYEYYQYVDGVSVLYANVSSIGQNALTYFFMTFNSVERANSFFSGYFSNKSEEVTSYLSAYLQSYSSAQNVTSRGETYSVTAGTDTLSLHDSAAASLDGLTEPLRVSFLNLCKRLSTTASSKTDDPAPFNYLVNMTNINALASAGGFTDGVASFSAADGTVVAKIVNIVNKDYIISNTETAKIIICTGDVIVSSNYSGLIIAQGSVEVRADVSSASVSSALQAKNTSGKTVLDYLNIGSGTGSNNTSATEGETWNVDDLVVYFNWQKS